MNHKYITGAGVVFMAFTFASCNSNEPLVENENGPQPITFETHEIQFAQSRGLTEKIIDRIDLTDNELGDLKVEISESAGIANDVSRGNYLNGPNDFAVSAYLARTDEGYTSPNYFYNEKASRASGKWATENPHIWPGKGYKLQFFAVAPFDHGQKYIDKDMNAVPALTVGLSSVAKEQKDILVACDDVANATSGSIFLQFQHIMSAIKVKFEAGLFADCHIYGVTISNAYMAGVYFPNRTIASQAGNWQRIPGSQGGANSSVSMDVDAIYQNSTILLDILNGDEMFMMIPQSTDKITLAVHYSQNKGAGEGSEHGSSISFTLPSTEWLPGHTYSYSLRKAQ